MRGDNRALDLGLSDRTTRLVVGRRVWSELLPILLPHSQTATAAIAYIGSAAAQFLPLTAGSSIIADASDKTVRSGATDPRVLLAWVKSGVKVYSLHDLHAKMILAERSSEDDGPFLAVGSANASSASATRLYESVILTDNDETLEEARASLIQWKTLAGGPMTIRQLEKLAEIYDSETAAEDDAGEDDGVTDEAEGDETPWPRPTVVYVAPIGLQGDPSEESLHQRDKLSQEFECGESDSDAGWFKIAMFWWDEEVDPDLEPNWTYPEGSHVIVVNGSKSGRMLASSKLSEPGRVVHSYTETEGKWSRTYYYLHSKLSDESHNLSELKDALTAIDIRLDYDAGYRRQRVVDALLGIWSDIEYSEDS